MADHDHRDSDSPQDASGGSTPPPPPPPGSSRRPVDYRAAQAAPPAPPPGYPWAPPKQKRGLIASFTKLVSAAAIAIALIGLGYYAAVITFLSGGERVSTSLYQPGEGEKTVAIIPIEGLISDPTARFVREAVETVLEDENVGAVVLRVDSGGGMVGPSDRIYHQFSRIGEQRGIPIVASFGGFAASGGYYVACAADQIYAEPTCVTGSIGVIANVISVHGTLEDLLQAQPIVETARTSPQKAVANSPLVEWDENDRAKLRDILSKMHDRFRSVVADARKPLIEQKEADFDAVTDGSVYMAEAALANGLVDQIGYLDAAIRDAVQRGDFEVDNPPIVVYSPPKPLLEQLGVGVRTDAAAALGELNGTKLRRTLMEFTAPRIMYWYPGAG